MLAALMILLSPAAADSSVWKDVWINLAQTENRCGTFDYHPNGGMRIFYCHMLSQVSYAAFVESAPNPIFLSGPHSSAALDLDNPTTFGHYNPAFVSWLGEHLVPAVADPAFRAQTQGLYDTYVAPLARIHHQTYTKLHDPKNAACTARERTLYERFIQDGEARGYYERWFFYMNPSFCERADDSNWFFGNGFDGGVSGNVAKTTVGFWLRRSIDGTDAAFHAALIGLLETYDAGWLSTARRATPPSARTPPPPPRD